MARCVMYGQVTNSVLRMARSHRYLVVDNDVVLSCHVVSYVVVHNKSE